ncbi:MAG: YggS family pyridoxal phosphate-dependent enzyme [Bacteroidales bacterium]|nr:YggS family pyridoxal phosphate-dependent enzyme [Bacteroidales bacterium]
MKIKENINLIKSDLPQNVRLVAVSKTVSVETILECYNANHKIFGENYVQELVAKQPLLPNDIQWHFIGHLQSNKIKYIAPFVACIQSVDSEKILKAIDKEARKNDRIIDVLLQFSIASDDSKFGFNPDETLSFLENNNYKNFKNVRICGVMGMSTFSDDEDLVRKEYRTLKSIFENLKKNIFNDESYFCEISMGMSHDYNVAIEEGATIVRIGSKIFGERIYK